MIVPAAAKAAIFALSSNGPSTRPPQGHILADLPVGTVLRVQRTARQSTVSPSRGRLQNSPTTPRFPQALLHLVQKKKKYKSRSTLAFPRLLALEALCRVNAVPNIWFNKTEPRSLPSLYPQIGLHSSASPTHPAALRCRYPPGPSIQSRSCGCKHPTLPARVASPCRRIRRISCRHRPAIAYSAALAAGAFFVSTTRHRLLSHPDDKETLQSPRLPNTVRLQELGPAKYLFRHFRLPATFTAPLQTLPSTGYPSG